MELLKRLLNGSLIAVVVILAGRIAILGFRPSLGLALLLLSPLALWLAVSQPLVTIRSGCFMVLVAGTKFRVRDPLASMQSEADAQVFFELAVYAVLGFLTLLVALKLPRAKLRFTGSELVLVAYVCVVLLSAAWSPTSTFSFIRGAQIGILLLYSFVTVRALGSDSAWTTLATSLLLFTIAFGLIGLVMTGAGLTVAAEGRFRWFFTHPIQVGSFAALASVALLSDFLFPGRGLAGSRRSVRIVSLILLVAILLMTQSRGPLLAFVAAVSALLMIRSLRSTAAAVGTVLVSVLALVLLNLPSGVVGLVDSLADSGIPAVEFLFRGQDVEDFLSMTGRMDLWAEMIPAFFQRPLFGYGYQAARIIGMEVAPWAGEAHNALVQSLIDVGLVGTLLLLVPAISTMISDYRLVAGPAGQHSARAAIVAAQFAMLLFLFVNSIGTAGFAGVPGFEPLLLFTAITASARAAASPLDAVRPG